MSFGLEVYDADGTKILDMTDYTYSKIFETIIPQASSSSELYYTVNVPGYDPDDCVVLFSPVTYIQGAQDDGDPNLRFVPTYRDLGGTSIGVVRTAYFRVYNFSTESWDYYRTVASAQSRMEVYRVFN